GYVIVPPSLHPSGRQYAWLCPRPAIEAPEWLLTLLAPPPPPPAGERRSLAPGELITAYGRAPLEGLADELLRAPEGHRNWTLLGVARRAGRLEAAGELDRNLAESVLTAAALQTGLESQAVELTFKSGFEYGRQFPAVRAIR